jgi:hypothetical protein
MDPNNTSTNLRECKTMAEASKQVKSVAKPPAAGMGRKKGSVNKTTALVKDAIAQAADKLGGVDRLVKWAKEDAQNERAFWTQIYTKLLPLQVSGDPDNPLTHVHKIERKIIRAKPDD